MFGKTPPGQLIIPQGAIRCVVAKEFRDKPLQHIIASKVVQQHEPDHEDQQCDQKHQMRGNKPWHDNVSRKSTH